MAKIFRDLGDDAYVDTLIDAVQHGVVPDKLPEPGLKVGTWKKQKPTHFLNIDASTTADIDEDDIEPRTIWDTKEEGLRLYIGKGKASWQYFRQSREHGIRKHVYKPIGPFDRGHFIANDSNPNPHVAEPPLHRAKGHVSCADARRQARIYAGKVEEGTVGPNVRGGPTFRQAFTGGFRNEHGDEITGYLEYLKATAKPTSKWPYNVERLGETMLLPQWGNWPLIEMGKRPVAFKEWYLAQGGNPTSANHCARIIRAVYRRAAGVDHRLPPRDPVASLGKKEWHKEVGEQKGLAASKFPAWFKAWKEIPNATHRAYHLVNLLIGARPGQLGVVRWRDLDLDAMQFTMPDAVKNEGEMGNDITVPITPEIAAAFKLAKTDPKRPDGIGCKADDLIFPGCINNPTRDKLPARGHALRRTWRTIAEDHCKVPDGIADYLEGRMPEGVKGRYLIKWERANGPNIIEAQQQISRAITALLVGKGAKLAKASAPKKRAA